MYPPPQSIAAIVDWTVTFVALWNCYHVIQDRRAPEATMAWVFALLAFPYVGVPVYYLLGQNRVLLYRSRLRATLQQVARESVGPTPMAPAPPPVSEDGGAASVLSTFTRVFERLGSEFQPTQNSVKILVDGQATFLEIFSAIDRAERLILVQYYILRSDRLGLELKNLLIRKALAGVQVYVLYDDMGSFWLRRDYIRDLKKAQVDVARFLPITNIKRLQFNFRNHRKLVIVDSKVAFTGGLNVGDEYVGRHLNRYWRDTHVRIEGPAVEHLQNTFIDDWYFATGRGVKVAATSRPRASSNNGSTPFGGPRGRQALGVRRSHHEAPVQVISSGPTDESLVAPTLFLLLIHSAQKRLWIATPYFIPDPALQRALELAVLRGVDVRLLIPDQSDSRLVHWAGLTYAEELVEKGVGVLRYSRGFMHQKVVLVDDSTTAIGTTNFDNRAMYLNFETMLVIHQESCCREIEEMLLADFAASAPMAPRKNRRITRLRGDLTRLLAPIL